jgi:hypothetical protein
VPKLFDGIEQTDLAAAVPFELQFEGFQKLTRGPQREPDFLGLADHFIATGRKLVVLATHDFQPMTDPAVLFAPFEKVFVERQKLHFALMPGFLQLGELFLQVGQLFFADDELFFLGSEALVHVRHFSAQLAQLATDSQDRRTLPFLRATDHCAVAIDQHAIQRDQARGGRQAAIFAGGAVVRDRMLYRIDDQHRSEQRVEHTVVAGLFFNQIDEPAPDALALGFLIGTGWTFAWTGGPRIFGNQKGFAFTLLAQIRNGVDGLAVGR